MGWGFIGTIKLKEVMMQDHEKSTQSFYFVLEPLVLSLVEISGYYCPIIPVRRVLTQTKFYGLFDESFLELALVPLIPPGYLSSPGTIENNKQTPSNPKHEFLQENPCTHTFTSEKLKINAC